MKSIIKSENQRSKGNQEYKNYAFVESTKFDFQAYFFKK